MVDRRIRHATTKPTSHSRASARLEQRPHRRSEATAEMACPHWSGPPFGMELSRFQEDDEIAVKREKPEDIALNAQPF